MLLSVLVHAGPLSPGDVLLLRASHYLVDGEVGTIWMFPMEKRGRDPHFVRDLDGVGGDHTPHEGDDTGIDLITSILCIVYCAEIAERRPRRTNF
jgi:hypothetical protein